MSFEKFFTLILCVAMVLGTYLCYRLHVVHGEIKEYMASCEPAEAHPEGRGDDANDK
jgi:hypothetical protein